MLKRISDWFWTDSFWLPYGFHWTDVTNCPISYLYITPVVAVVILIVRHLFERHVAYPMCRHIGIPMITPASSDSKRKASEREFLDESTEKHTPHTNHRMFMKTKSEQDARQMQKALETSWRCVAYFFLFVYGALVVLRSDWFWQKDSWLIGKWR